ncbi:MAG: cytochrome c3 family protein [Pseudomonadota bacterium]
MTGRIARGALAAAAAAIVAWVQAQQALAQFFSPGPLARPHSGLEGLEKCSKCHQEQKGLSAKLCLACHTEVEARIAKGAGFHGRMPPDTRDVCQSCHPDHRGLDFAMTEWPGGRDHFDHQKTGWPLKGAHAKTRCDDCHQKPLIVDASIRRLLDRFPKQVTQLGLSERCDSCHFDEHRGQLGRECAKCHDEKAWKPEPGFDHQKTAYPLLGKHKDVPCAKCHQNLTDEHFVATAVPRPRAATFMEMKPIDHKTCESCHDDPHKGTLGPACASCHSEIDWKIIKTVKDRDTTFHDKTRFPLRGGHIGVPCRSCHGPFPGQPAKFKGLAFAACSDCHQDAHLGQIKPTPPAKVAACDGCHTVNAFVPVRYELEQHAKTPFPLEGAHAASPCRGCHPIDEGLAARITASVHRLLAQRKRPELFSFAVLHPKKSPDDCAGCHADVHRGQFASAGGANHCAACHKTTSFSDLVFDHDKQSRFPLTGKHAATPCAGCHKTETPRGGGAAFVRYKPLGTSCGGCHTDVHQGQFLTAALARDCDFCHQTQDFKKTIFDHNDRRFTTFALDGKHAKVKCAGCHPVVRISADITTVRYRPVPRTCEECHVDFHHGAFKGFEP